jgi:thiamine biosynthesis lipoprotein ApbE
VDAQLRALDESCSRFRDDSELVQLNAAGGRTVLVSRLLLDAMAVAIRAAELTDGDVDPTLAEALELAGYDRDFDELPPPAGDTPLAPPSRIRVRRRPGWRAIQLDRRMQTIRLAAGVRVDLGATAKALAADRAAAAVWEATGSGVLVNLGGDIRVAGPAPDGGWRVRVTDEPGAGVDGSGQTIALEAGGLATSSTTARRWRHGGELKHHILDPASGEPARPVWRAVSVAAASCLDANTASTAAIVRGERAPAWLEQLCLPSRLVATDGSVVLVGGWPEAT